MRYGIPKYRLPRDVLDAEVERIAELGVKFELGHNVVDVIAEQLEGRFDAAFLAVGARLASRAYVPAGSAAKIIDAVSLLRDMEDGSAGPPQLGRRVAVYGGGNTAMDAARTAKRLGRGRVDHRLPPHSGPDAGARVRARGGTPGGDPGQVADDDQARRRRPADHRADGAGRERLPAADRPVRAARRRHAGARDRSADRSLTARGRRRDRGGGRRRQGRPEPDDRARGDLRRRRHGPGRAHRHGRDRPWPSRRARHRSLAAGRSGGRRVGRARLREFDRCRPRARSGRGSVRGPQHLVLRGRAQDRPA